jgi:carbonic anhydrase
MRDKGYEELLFHPLTDHGGASIMSPRSRIGLRSDADALVRKIGFAIQAKGAQHVALYAHSPCGAAAHYGVPLPTMLSDLVLAKQRVTEAYPALQSVACYFHVDRSGESGRLSAWKAFRRHPARVILKVLGIATHSSWIAFVGDHNKRTYHLDSDRLREWQSTKESREYLRATWGIS